MPILWTEFAIYFGTLIYMVKIKKIKMEGQFKWAIYAYNIPMLVRAILTTILNSSTQNVNSGYYSYQMIIYKMCLFIAILVGFMMKKIEILINFDQLTKQEFKR